MVWVAFFQKSLGPPIVLHGCEAANKHEAILSKQVPCMLQTQFHDGPIFQDDYDHLFVLLKL